MHIIDRIFIAVAAVITVFCIVVIDASLNDDKEELPECSYKRIMELEGDKQKLIDMSQYCKLPEVVEKYANSSDL